jgi:ribosome biogenesis protein MAK21
MKSFVLHEMENLLFRPNASIHAQYYTIITMNQTILTSRDTAVANRLIEVYFMLFIKLLRNGIKDPIIVESKKPKPKKRVKGEKKKKRGAVDWDSLNQQEEEVNSKILSAVLTGMNRAFPFSKVENDVYDPCLLETVLMTGLKNIRISFIELLTMRILIPRFKR